MNINKKVFFGVICLALSLYGRTQSTNLATREIDIEGQECKVLVTIIPSTNMVIIGGAFTILENVQNLSTHSIALNSSNHYFLVNGSGKKYELSIIIDALSDTGPNINAPPMLAGKGEVEASYTFQVNTNVVPGDFHIEITKQFKTSNNKICFIQSNAPKLKVIAGR